MSSTTQSFILLASAALVLAGPAVDSANCDARTEGPSAFVATPSVAPAAVEAVQPAPVVDEVVPTAGQLEGDELLYFCEGPVG